METGIPNTRQRVAKNAGIYLLIQVVSWCVTFVALSVIPRRLGEQASGELLLGSLTVQVVFTVGAMCTEDFLTRETGRDRRSAERLVRATLGLRLTLLLLLAGVAFVALRVLDASPTVLFLGMLSIPAACLGLLGDPLRAVLAGRERAKEASLSDLYQTASPLPAIPFLGYGPIALVVTRTLAQAIGLLFKFRWLRDISLRPIFDVALWRELIVGSAPFMLNKYVGMFNGYVAMLVLNHYVNEAAISEFNQSNRLIGTFLVVPTVLSAAMLPVLARLADLDRETFTAAKTRVLTLVIVSCLPVMVGMALLAHPLCHVLYGHRYVHVPLALQIGAVQLLPLYIIMVSLQFLVAQGRNALWSWALASTLMINVGLAWFLIPLTMRTMHTGIAGAMIADTAAEFGAMGMAFWLMQVNPFAPALLGRLLRGALAAAAMAGVVWVTRDALARLPLSFVLSNLLQLFVPALLGGAVFVLLAWLLKAFPPEEQELVVRTLRRKLRRAG